MSSTPTSPEKRPEIDDFDEVIRQAIESEIGELAAFWDRDYSPN